jgi:hypothetical protein
MVDVITIKIRIFLLYLSIFYFIFNQNDYLSGLGFTLNYFKMYDSKNCKNDFSAGESGGISSFF